MHVSPVCVGMVDSPRTIAAAFEAGINFFLLTADMHWPYYEATRRGLARLFASGRNVRDQVVVAVACYPTQPEFCSAPFIEVLEAVPHLRRIDVGVMGGVYTRDFASRLEVYRHHRRSRHAGIGAIGASFHERRAARAALASSLVDLAFVRYNAGHPGARTDLLPYRSRRNPTRVYNFTSTRGFVPPARMAALGLGPEYWRPAITDHYRFALMRPGIDGLLCALNGPREVRALAGAMEAGPLDRDEERFLVDLAALDQGRATLRAAGKRGSGRSLRGVPS